MAETIVPLKEVGVSVGDQQLSIAQMQELGMPTDQIVKLAYAAAVRTAATYGEPVPTVLVPTVDAALAHVLASEPPAQRAARLTSPNPNLGLERGF